MHSVVVIVLYSTFAMCCCAIPPIYMTERSSKQIFVGVAIALTSIVGSAVHYATVSVPLSTLQQSIDSCLEHYYETERRIELSVSKNNLVLLTSKCADRTPVLLANFNVNSFLKELCGTQASAKNACETLLASVAMKAKLRAETMRAMPVERNGVPPPLQTPSTPSGRPPLVSSFHPLADKFEESVQRQLDPALLSAANAVDAVGTVRGQVEGPKAAAHLPRVLSTLPPPLPGPQHRDVSGGSTSTLESCTGVEASNPSTPLRLLATVQQQALPLSDFTVPPMPPPVRRTTSVISVPQLESSNAGECFTDRSSLGSTPAWSTTFQFPPPVEPLPLRAALAPPAPTLLPIARGERFAGDKVEIFLYCERSLNRNIVVYEAIMEHDGRRPPPPPPPPHGRGVPAEVALSLSSPVRSYWLDIDPAYVAKKRKKGIFTDDEELNFVEKKMAYGLTSTLEVPEANIPTDAAGRRLSRHVLVPSVVSAVRSHHSFTLKFAALPTQDMRLVLLHVLLSTHSAGAAVPTVVPVVECIVDGKRCVLERVYVATSTSAFRTSPDYVDLFGLSVEEASFGQPTSERVTY